MAAKKAKRRPLRLPKAAPTQHHSTTQTRSYQASKLVHPSPPTPPTPPPQTRRRAVIRLRNTITTPTPTLGDRFHALPPELRREIFALLLIQPVKWNLPHQKTCPLTQHSWPINPYLTATPYATCVRCQPGHVHTRRPLWRNLQPPDPAVESCHRNSAGAGLDVWRDPWRSAFAPPVANAFMCSACWDVEMRARPHPAQREVGARHLRCLCARRQGLDVLLVCRRWYEEAGSVFYARNTFAFESAAVLKAFVGALSARWRERVTRVSFVAFHPPEPEGPVEEAGGWEGNGKLRRVWGLLQLLPRLSYLELDAHFLSRAKVAHRLLKLRLRSVRRVCFVMHNPWPGNSSKGSPWVWPEYHDARLVVGGFAEEVARAIKGQKQRCGLRRTQHVAILRAAEREERIGEHAMALHNGDHEAGMACGNICFSTSATAYARLWWKEQKQHAGGNAAHCSRLNGLHAYIPTEYTHFNAIRVETREGHWRDWQPTSYRVDDFGTRNLAMWREKAGWDVLFPIQPGEFLDETQKERTGWEFLAPIEV